MANTYFQFKQFTLQQDRCAMKVTTDACLFGAWIAADVHGTYPAANRMLDIGTGTGLLSLMIAQASPLQIDAVELDANTAMQAKENNNASPWADRITTIHNDIKNIVPSIPVYDLVVSNPPFYENELASPDAQKNIAHHDAGLSLQELLKAIKRTLAPTGKYYILLPAKRTVDAELLTGRHDLSIDKMIIVKATPQHPPSRIFIRGGHVDEYLNDPGKKYQPEELIIKEDNGEYTQGFRRLLKEYYLYL